MHYWTRPEETPLFLNFSLQDCGEDKIEKGESIRAALSSLAERVCDWWA